MFSCDAGPGFSAFIPPMGFRSPSEGFLLPGPLCFWECRWEKPPGTKTQTLAAGRHWGVLKGLGDTGRTWAASAGTALLGASELCDLSESAFPPLHTWLVVPAVGGGGP